MKARDLREIGLPEGRPIKLALRACAAAAAGGMDRKAIAAAMRAVLADPAAHLADAAFGELAADDAGEGRKVAEDGIQVIRLQAQGGRRQIGQRIGLGQRFDQIENQLRPQVFDRALQVGQIERAWNSRRLMAKAR